MTSLGTVDIKFNTMDSDLTKRSMYGKDNDLDRVVSGAAAILLAQCIPSKRQYDNYNKNNRN